MCEIIRIVSLRKSSPSKPRPGDAVFPIHRGNKVLGNKAVMKDFSKAERTRVIEEFREILEKDLVIEGPIYQALMNIAKYHVKTGRVIALECWCAPDDCHGDLLIPVLEDMIEKLKKET